MKSEVGKQADAMIPVADYLVVAILHFISSLAMCKEDLAGRKDVTGSPHDSHKGSETQI